MRQRRMTIVAIACGAACALCVGLFMASVQGEADAARAEVLSRYGGEQVEVCVATRDIAAGERVDLSAVETKLWIADLLPGDPVQTASDVIGKTATSSILRGEVVSLKRFEAASGELEVPAGKEAVSVPAKAVQAVGGAIKPGMGIDLYIAGDTATSALARGVVVLATSIGGSGSLVGSDSGWITLAVDPQNVREVIAAASRASLYFALPGEGVEHADAGTREAGAASSPAATAASSAGAVAGSSAGASAGAAASDGDGNDEADSENGQEQDDGEER